MKNNQHQPGYIQLTAQGDMPVTLEVVVPLLTTPGKMLITGFLKSYLEVCRSGILLAEKTGAYCDGWFSHAERVFLSSWQREAWANCTWGEVRERADFILCWKAEEPSGLSCISEVINAVSPAALWQICSSETRKKQAGTQSVYLKNEDQLEFLNLLNTTATHIKSGLNVKAQEKLIAIKEHLQRAHYPVVIWGGNWNEGDEFYSTQLVHAQLRWAREANAKYRLHHVRLSNNPGLNNFTTAANWLTGNTTSLFFNTRENQHQFNSGFKHVKCEPDFFKASRLIRDREVTKLLWIGDMPAEVSTFLRSNSVDQQSPLTVLQLKETSNLHGTFMRDDGIPVYMGENGNSVPNELEMLIMKIPSSS